MLTVGNCLAEVEQLLLGQPAFQKGSGVDARRTVALDIEKVATVGAAAVGVVGMPEMVETGREHVSQAGEAADVAAEVAAVGGVQTVGLDHHGHGVPAHVGPQTAFELQVAGAVFLVGGLDGVDVAGVGGKRHVDAALARLLQQLLQEEVGAFGTFGLDDCGQGVEPLAGFLGVGIVGSQARRGLRHCGHACLLLRGCRNGGRKCVIAAHNFK
jgi:hypothetical protein